MASRRGRLTATALAASVLVALGAGGFAYRERIVQEWYAWKLRSSQGEERRLLAWQLGERRSTWTVPLLTSLLRDVDALVRLYAAVGLARTCPVDARGLKELEVYPQNLVGFDVDGVGGRRLAALLTAGIDPEGRLALARVLDEGKANRHLFVRSAAGWTYTRYEFDREGCFFLTDR